LGDRAGRRWRYRRNGWSEAVIRQKDEGRRLLDGGLEAGDWYDDHSLACYSFLHDIIHLHL